MTQSENHIANADDFRSAAYEQAFEPEERVVLPESGLPVVLRRPRLIFFTLTKNPYPQEVAEKIASVGAGAASAEKSLSGSGAGDPARPGQALLSPPGAGGQAQGPAPTADDLKAYADWLTEVLGAVFVKPRLGGLAPGPDEIHPNWLRPGDVQFIFLWMVGGIGDVGACRRGDTPLQFRSADAGGGAGGGGVSLPAERDPARVDRRVEN